MKLFNGIMGLVFSILLFSGFFALAQAVTPAPIPACSADMDFFQCLGLSIGSFKGASVLLIVAIVVQLLVKLLNSSLFSQWFSGVSGALKLLIISGLTIVGSVVGLMYSNNMTFLSALTSGGILTSLMVFANQVYQQFASKPIAPQSKR